MGGGNSSPGPDALEAPGERQGRRAGTRRRLTQGVRVAGLFGASLRDVGRPLEDPRFRWLWTSTLAWNFARWMELTVTSWVVLELTHSPWLVALVGVSRSAFLPVAGPITGALSDRFDRVVLMKAAQWGNALVMGAMAASLVSGHGTYWQLVLSSLWLGISWGIDWPSRRALMADLVGPQRVLQAVVLDNVTQNGARIVGPLVGGVLLKLIGGQWTFACLALAFLLASVATIPVAVETRERKAMGQSVFREMAAGLEYVRRDSAVWGVLLITVLMNCLMFPYQQLLSVFAEQILDVGPVGLGYMGAANGVGASMALLLLPPLRSPRWQGLAFAGGSILACTAVAMFSASRAFELSFALLLFAGLGQSAFGTMQSTIVLSRSSIEMRGRAMGLLALCIGSAPLGALEIGFMVEKFGAPLAVGVNAGLCALLVAWVGLRSGLFARRRVRVLQTAASA